MVDYKRILTFARAGARIRVIDTAAFRQAPNGGADLTSPVLWEAIDDYVEVVRRDLAAGGPPHRPFRGSLAPVNAEIEKRLARKEAAA